MIWALIAVVFFAVVAAIFAVLWFRMGEEWYEAQCEIDALEIKLADREAHFGKD